MDDVQCQWDILIPAENSYIEEHQAVQVGFVLFWRFYQGTFADVVTENMCEGTIWRSEGIYIISQDTFLRRVPSS